LLAWFARLVCSLGLLAWFARRYVCMQKPFKRQPEFDTMLAGVLEADPEAVLILHDVDGATNRKILVGEVVFPRVKKYHEISLLFLVWKSMDFFLLFLECSCASICVILFLCFVLFIRAAVH